MFNIIPWITCIYCQCLLLCLSVLLLKIRISDMLFNEHKQFIWCIHLINSLLPSDSIWRQRSGSTLAQVMACCLSAPSHYLNQCWLIISEAQISTISQEMPQPSITKICLKITGLKFNSNFPGANELMQCLQCWHSFAHCITLCFSLCIVISLTLAISTKGYLPFSCFYHAKWLRQM